MWFLIGAGSSAGLIALLSFAAAALGGSIDEPQQFVLIEEDNGFDWKWLLGLIVPAALGVWLGLRR